VSLRELPVPPTVPANGVCTNPTGCVSGTWGALGAPGFFWDPQYVLLGVTYAGAPAAPNPASIFGGPQVLLVKTDGTRFPNGDPWKCLTCGVPAANEPGLVAADLTYPPAHALPGDRRVLVGNGILECGAGGVTYVVTDSRCTPANTHIFPIYWGPLPLGAPSGTFGNGREWRLNPDGVHLAWSQLIITSGTFNEFAFMGRLTFNQANQRYDLTNVTLLPNAAPYAVLPGNRLQFQPHQMIGELRGWTNDGRSVLGIQSYTSDNVDAWATSLATGRSVPLTDHAEYTDPMFMSPNGKWLLAEEVLGSGRLDFISGMQGVPPITDQLTTTGYVSGIRNNFNRRFFLPWLVHEPDRRSEQVNAGGDPNWNAAADPVWLADSTAVVWAENLACGANPTPHQCPASTEPGARNSRVMIARFPFRRDVATPPDPVSDTVPWGTPYAYGQAVPDAAPFLPAGTFTVAGRLRGSATVVVADNGTNTAITSIAVTYHDYSDVPGYVVNGSESVLTNGTVNPLHETVTWFENLTLSGRHRGTKVTSSNGFTLGPSVLLSNDFEPTGTMTTIIDGRTYVQPANGT
jgi:hypothetical protein